MKKPFTKIVYIALDFSTVYHANVQKHHQLQILCMDKSMFAHISHCLWLFTHMHKKCVENYVLFTHNSLDVLLLLQLVAFHSRNTDGKGHTKIRTFNKLDFWLVHVRSIILSDVHVTCEKGLSRDRFYNTKILHP